MLIEEDDDIEDNMIEDNDGDSEHLNHPLPSILPPNSHMIIDEDDFEDNMIEDNNGDNDHPSHLFTSPAPMIPPIESRSPPIPSQLPWPIDPPYRDAP
jgi:hypothetical protein